MQQKSDPNQRVWENAEFPILCEGNTYSFLLCVCVCGSNVSKSFRCMGYRVLG